MACFHEAGAPDWIGAENNGETDHEPIGAAVGDGPGAMTRVAAGLAGPGGSATPGRVLGSGEDVRTVPSWRPLRSASDRGRRCVCGRTRAHRASDKAARRDL